MALRSSSVFALCLGLNQHERITGRLIPFTVVGQATQANTLPRSQETDSYKVTPHPADSGFHCWGNELCFSRMSASSSCYVF